MVFTTLINKNGTILGCMGTSNGKNIIDERYSPNSWNIYAFHCSDGENWPEDNEKAKNY